MGALRQFISLLILSIGSLSFGVWGDEAPSCVSEISGVTELAPVHFLYVDPDNSIQRALIEPSDQSWGWIEIKYFRGTLRVHNRMPGFGIPLNVFHVKAEVIDSYGREVSDLGKSFPDSNSCFMLGLFPGQQSPDFPIYSTKPSAEKLRLRVRVWVSDRI